MMPWKLLSDFSAYIFGWLVGYSGLLGPIAGVMIADYFIVRHRSLNVDDLYRRGGEYEYSKGVNPRAMVSLVLGVVVAAAGARDSVAALAVRLRVVCRFRRFSGVVCGADVWRTCGSSFRGGGRTWRKLRARPSDKLAKA